MKKVTVPLENRSYDILIGEDLISNFPSYLGPLLSREFLAIVTDKNLENLIYPNFLRFFLKQELKLNFSNQSRRKQ